MKLSKDEILRLIRADIEQAEQYAENIIIPAVKTRYDIYNASDSYYEKLMPRLSKKSKVVSTDVADVIEWIMPRLMQTFFGSDDIISVQGRNEEDTPKADILQKLCNYQISVLNNGFMVFYRWFKDALITGLGIVKCYWDRKYEYEDLEEFVGEEQFQLMQADENIEIKDYSIFSQDPISLKNVFKVKYRIKNMTKNQPVIENVPITEFLFDFTAKSINEAKYIIHKKKVTIDYLKTQAEKGIYDKKAVNEIEENAPTENDELDVFYVTGQEENIQNINNELQPARNSVYLYECYEKLDINDDGKLEDVIITICGNKVLRIEENTYGRSTFFTLSAILEPYKIFGKGMPDVIGQLQDLKTALLKELVTNLSLSNESKLLIREDAVYVEDLLTNRPFVRIRQNVPNIHNVITPMTPKPIHQLTMPMLEYIDYTRENRSGITRYSQGMDANSLNHTATGISQIMQASNQRLELIIRIFAETGIKEFFSFLIELNQKFIDKNQVIRLTNKELEITPDDLDGKFDLIVNAGITLGTPEKQLQALQMMMSHTMQVLLPNGLAKPEHIYNLTKLMYEKLGYKNIGDFMIPIEQLQQQQQMMMQNQQMQQTDGQQEMPQQEQIKPELMQQLMMSMQQGG